MASATFLTKIKIALRISTNAFDDEISNLIDDGLAEMEALGVTIPATPEDDPQIVSTTIARCKWLFGENENADKWRDIYDRKLAQFQTMTGYTTWRDSEEA